MGVITAIVFGFMIIGFFVDMYWKLKNRMQRYDGMSKYKEIPSPPAYPLLKHLPHLWRDTNLTQQLLKWSKMFANEGIFRYDPLLGKTLRAIDWLSEKNEYDQRLNSIQALKYIPFHRKYFIGFGAHKSNGRWNLNIFLSKIMTMCFYNQLFSLQCHRVHLFIF